MQYTWIIRTALAALFAFGAIAAPIQSKKFKRTFASCDILLTKAR
jgi:hypothetical protein